MIPYLTQRDIGYSDSVGKLYCLPPNILHVNLSDEEVRQRTYDTLASTLKNHAHIRFVSLRRNPKTDRLIAQFIYDGYEEYYLFDLEIDWIRYQKTPSSTYTHLPDRHPILSIILVQEHGPLFEELLDINFFPEFEKIAQLTSYYKSPSSDS